MGAAPARNDPPAKALSVRCPQCQARVEINVVLPATLPCPTCQKLFRVKQG